MRIHYPAHRLLQRAQLVARENRWQQPIRPSRPERPLVAFVKPIVTGDKVIAHHAVPTAEPQGPPSPHTPHTPRQHPPGPGSEGNDGPPLPP